MYKYTYNINFIFKKNHLKNEYNLVQTIQLKINQYRIKADQQLNHKNNNKNNTGV